MRVASIVSRYLLGLIFTVFGLNGFLHFIPMQPMPGLAGQFMGAIFQSQYFIVIFAVQAIAGVLLLVNRYVPLALVSLAAMIVNILTFHISMAPSGLPLPLVVSALWVVVALSNRAYLASLFVARTEPGKNAVVKAEGQRVRAA